MSCKKRRILIVDDEPLIRMSMSCIFSGLGYSVRTAEDGLSALREICLEQPEILLSDLNMPVMSGFELLSMVRRQFPAIQTIAMSGAYSGIEVPSGVDADAFYEKGRNLEALLQLFSTPPRISRPALAPLLLHEIATLQSKHSARNHLPRRLDESAGLSA